MESAVWGLIGTAVGAGASIATTFLSNRNAAQLQANSSVLDRMEKHKSFQRDTLLELQDAFHDAIRLVTRVHFEETKSLTATGHRGKDQFPDELAEVLRIANRRVMLLVERVHNDEVRTTIKVAMANANNVISAPTKEESRTRLDLITLESVAAIEKIGETLRQLY